jgi:hypothetical protein
MSAARRPLHGLTAEPDTDSLARYIASIRAEIEPDPLFTRRLRGQVVNSYVASREGVASTRPAPAAGERREMTRIGRAVLYASFGLALSVTTVMGAAQQAVPGDVLYAFKLQVEELRRDILPAQFQDELTAIELAERLEEMARLSERQEAARAADLLDAIRTEYSVFASELVDPEHPEALEARQVVIEGLVERLPDPAAEAVEAVITEVDASLEEETIPAAPDGNPGGAMNDGTNPNGSTNQGGANNDGTPGKAGSRGPGEDWPAPAALEPDSRAAPSSGD